MHCGLLPLRSRPQRRATGAVLAGAVSAAALLSGGQAVAQTAPALTAEEAQQLQAELKAMRAEAERARAEAIERERKVAALQNRLNAATGAPLEIQAPSASAAGVPASESGGGGSFEVYGFAQIDYIQDFKRVHPDWDATLRPSRIPTVDGIYGDDGQSILSVRQSRFGVRATQPIGGRDLFARFEFDLYGVGDDAGQTTFRLRHAYGEWGPILAGQTNSLFMDGDTFPNTVDYWGPNGMVFLRNPQIRYTYKSGSNQFSIALEQPSNDIDPGNVRLIDSDIAESLQGDEEIPDLTAQWRHTGDWGHFQAAGILRRVGFETAGTPNNEPSDSKMGWGINLSSNIKVYEKDVIHLSVVYGEGIASYMNDGGMDLAPRADPAVTPPIVGVPPPGLRGDVVPLLGVMIYFDHYWNNQFSSSIGYSLVQVDNTNFQEPTAFKAAQYASANLLYTPSDKILMGGEFLWGTREDKDGADGEDYRLQFTFKYNFSSNDFR